jgi:ribonuclease P protein component
MLAKSRRLVKERDFENIFKVGQSYYTKLFGVKTINNQKNSNRFGIIVSAKVSKKATERNKLKRQIRQIIEEFEKKMVMGFDTVIIALPSSLNYGYKTITGELEKIFIKLRLFK